MKTTLEVVKSLNLEPDQWSLSFQSRLGPVKWLEPSTVDKVAQLVGSGVKKLAIVAPAFLVDGLETLEELEIGIRADFMRLGGEELTVIKCLNDEQEWIDGLMKIIENRFQHSISSTNLSASSTT
jgi:ferrochelatase